MFFYVFFSGTFGQPRSLYGAFYYSNSKRYPACSMIDNRLYEEAKTTAREMMLSEFFPAKIVCATVLGDVLAARSVKR